MIPSKYVPKQLEFLFFPYNRDFCHVYVVAVGTVPYKLIRLHSINEWNESSLFNSFWASCIVSSPYMSLDMTTELKTRRNPCNTGVCFVPKSFSWAHVLMAFAKRSWNSAILLAVSVNIVPKYFACRCRGTKEPSLNLIDDVFLLVVRFTHFS